MKVAGKHTRTIWLAADAKDGIGAVEVIDQRKLPHAFVTVRLETLDEAATAISDMWIRGAPLIGATAAYGIALAMRSDPSDSSLAAAYDILLTTRPTAINLKWALEDLRHTLKQVPPERRAQAAYRRAAEICDEDVAICSSIGDHGFGVIKEIAARKKAGEVTNILTHCNAGWLATVDWGTALAPIYKAFDAGMPIHVWVDETRPRNQGASLTAWELNQHGVPHTVIVDNVGGHLMQHGRVDMCIVGTDRTTTNGDVCNKIGTYLKALAAHDNNVPFYVGLPSPTIDWTMKSGMDIPIEERDGTEVTVMSGRTKDGQVVEVTITPEGSPAANFGFDVTPARLITGLVTERGVCAASEAGLKKLFPGQLSAIGPSGRYWSLGFGVTYISGAVLAGFNQELIWELFAPDGVSGQTRHLVSVLTTVYPHVLAVPGLALLIAGLRMSRLVFILTGLFPVVATIACLAIRASY